MVRHRVAILLGLVVAALVGCATEETTTTTTTETSPSPAVSPSPAASPSPTTTQAGTNPQAGADTKAGAKPLVAQKPGQGGGALPAVPGLIQPTNSKEHGAQVSSAAKLSNRDPFAGLPPAPVKADLNSPQQATTASTAQQQKRLPAATPLFPQIPIQIPILPTKAVANAPGKAGAPGQGGKGTVATAPGKGGRPTITLPPKPSTDLANGVEVTGVALLRGIPQAIVKAPDEATSRYVRVGERLSNGKVLVKRIEFMGGSEPIVILEENGIEVSRGVGEKPVAQTSKPNA